SEANRYATEACGDTSEKLRSALTLDVPNGSCGTRNVSSVASLLSWSIRAPSVTSRFECRVIVPWPYTPTPASSSDDCGECWLTANGIDRSSTKGEKLLI